MESNERVVGGMCLGCLLFGWCVWMLSRVVASVFHELGLMFNAIGTAASNFIAMAWTLAQLIGILAAGAAVVYAAYRHYKLVKESSDILALVEARCGNLASDLEASQKQLEKSVNANVDALHMQLAEALAEPEVGPEQVTDAPPQQIAQSEEVVTEAINESATTPRVSSPY